MFLVYTENLFTHYILLMRYSSGLAICVLILVIATGLVLIDFKQRLIRYKGEAPARSSFRRLTGLPDLAITSGARYLRHYSLGDLSTPFQDYPTSPEHFPAGFVFAPPDYSNMFPNIILSSTKSGVMKHRVENPLEKYKK